MVFWGVLALESVVRVWLSNDGYKGVNSPTCGSKCLCSWVTFVTFCYDGGGGGSVITVVEFDWLCMCRLMLWPPMLFSFILFVHCVANINCSISKIMSDLVGYRERNLYLDCPTCSIHPVRNTGIEVNAYNRQANTDVTLLNIEVLHPWCREFSTHYSSLCPCKMSSNQAEYCSHCKSESTSGLLSVERGA